MSETETIAIVESPQEAKLIKPSDPKEAAFMLPAKEDIAGFTVHAFAKSRKGFLIATGNELLNTERHLAAYKEAHPDWQQRIERDAKPMVAEVVSKLAEANKIEDVDARVKAVTSINDEYKNNLDWLAMAEAVPDFMFQLSSLAYICVMSAALLSRLVGKPREYFNEQVATWADGLKDDEWDKLTSRAFQELVESNIGSDYKVKEEKNGTPASPEKKS